MTRKGAPTKASRIGTVAAAFATLVLSLFARLFAAPSWRPWSVWLKAVLGLPMTAAEQELARRCTGRATWPFVACREIWTIVGRRSGKTRLAAFVVICLATLKKYALAPGEVAVVLTIAPTLRQTQIILGYIEALLELVPGTSIRRRTADTIELSNGVSIQAQVASFRSLRGYTIVGAVLDEVAFFRDDSGKNPDTEILRAIRPALASVPGSLLVAISSPYSTRGELHRMFERYYGKESDVLVWQAPTRVMNETIPQALVDQAMEDDPSSANAEFLACFRTDLESLFSRAALEACVVSKRFELAFVSGTPYVGFVDPSGGSADSFTLAIGHRDHAGKAVLDLVREVKPPFSPEGVCQQFAATIKAYGCRVTYSDSYAAEWPREQLAKYGVTVTPSELTRSELYLELLPIVNSGACELLDHSRLINQLANLERRVGRTGRDAVDHPRGGADDVSNAVAGALTMVVRVVGLLAALPATFETCINFEAAGHRCAFMATSPWLPDDPLCRKYCIGHRAVWPLYFRHREAAIEAGEVPLSARKFLDQHFDEASAPLTRRIAWQRVQAMADALGI
jgi:hypothetical protein